MSLFVVFFPLVVTIAGTLVFMTKTKGNPELLKKTLDLWDSCFATGFQPAAEWIMERSKTRQAAWYKFIVGVNILIVGLMIIMDLFISIPFIIIGFLYFRCIRNNPGEDIDYDDPTHMRYLLKAVEECFFWTVYSILYMLTSIMVGDPSGGFYGLFAAFMSAGTLSFCISDKPKKKEEEYVTETVMA